MEGLELDIYVPSKKIAIEYQWQQHFIPVSIWGGQKALDRQKMNDLRKKKLCLVNDVKLICINYFDPIEYDFIKSKIL